MLVNWLKTGNDILGSREACPMVVLGIAASLRSSQWQGGERRILLDRLENILIGIDLKEGYTHLTKREKNIINLYYLEGYKDEEIAKLYGVCQHSVNESRQKGIKKLKYF